MEGSTGFGATISRLGQTPAAASSRLRWWTIVEAVGCIVAGCTFLVVPNRAVALLAVVLGLALLFVAGWLILAIAGSRSLGRRWRVVVMVVVAFVAGLLILAYPVVGAVALIVGLALWLLVTGARDVVIAWIARKHRVLNAVLGIVSILAGLSLVLPPGGILTDGVLLLLLAVGLIVRGILELVRLRTRATD